MGNELTNDTQSSRNKHFIISIYVNSKSVLPSTEKGEGSERLTISLQSRVPLGPGKFHIVVLVQNPFEAGNQLNAAVLSQSTSSNHALLITKSALVIKKKISSVSANQHSVISSVCDKDYKQTSQGMIQILLTVRCTGVLLHYEHFFIFCSSNLPM